MIVTGVLYFETLTLWNKINILTGVEVSPTLLIHASGLPFPESRYTFGFKNDDMFRYFHKKNPATK